MGRRYAAALIAAPLLAPAAHAQQAPAIDTEDASLGSTRIGRGAFHPIVGVDVRNGDFARGGYDDDAANLDRLPVHLQLGFAWALRRDERGEGRLWLLGTSSNGFHAPVPAERTAPRAWYESNNLIGLAARVGAGGTVALAYTIKASPNGIADTTHEASVTAALDGDDGVARLHPHAAATIRTRGEGGVFTQVGIAPDVALTEGEDGATLGFPLLVGVGWDGFYAAGTGDVVYGSAGLSYALPFVAGGHHWRFQADALALLRDPTLRRLGTLDAETDAVVPLATIGLTVAF